MSIDNVARGLAVRGGYSLAQSAAAVSHTGDTNEFTFATITLPAGTLGINARVEVLVDFTYPTSANVKTLKVKLGATAMINVAPTTTTGMLFNLVFANRGSAASQRFRGNTLASNNAGVQLAGTAAIDTTAAADITITGQLASAAETLILESYSVTIYPKG